MLDGLFPRRIDNSYRGAKAGLWLFGLVVAVKSAQSLAIIFNGDATARGADGIPLDTYPPDASRNILAVFAQASLWRLTFCVVGLLVLVRYRSAVPFMFLLFVLNYLAGQLIFQVAPLVRTGTPPGPIVNLSVFILMIVGLALSLWSRAARQAQ